MLIKSYICLINYLKTSVILKKYIYKIHTSIETTILKQNDKYLTLAGKVVINNRDNFIVTLTHFAIILVTLNGHAVSRYVLCLLFPCRNIVQVKPAILTRPRPLSK